MNANTCNSIIVSIGKHLDYVCTCYVYMVGQMSDVQVCNMNTLREIIHWKIGHCLVDADYERISWTLITGIMQTKYINEWCRCTNSIRLEHIDTFYKLSASTLRYNHFGQCSVTGVKIQQFMCLFERIALLKFGYLSLWN